MSQPPTSENEHCTLNRKLLQEISTNIETGAYDLDNSG